MFNFMKKSGGGVEKDEKEKKKKEKKERKENKKRERGSMTAEELLRLDEVIVHVVLHKLILFFSIKQDLQLLIIIQYFDFIKLNYGYWLSFPKNKLLYAIKKNTLSSYLYSEVIYDFV